MRIWVRPYGVWDYKVQDGWKYEGGIFRDMEIDYDWQRGIVSHMYYDGDFISAADFGNINYGYTGLAACFTRTKIYLWGGIVHQATAPFRDEAPSLKNWSSYFDDERDHKMITLGMNKYPFY